MKTKPVNRKLIVTVIFLFVFAMNANAQINDAYARITESGQNFNCSFIVELSDTLNTNQIEVSLGTAPDSTDVTFQTFTFDSTAPSGCTYSRNLLTLTLGVPALTEHRTYYANVRVNHSGNWTSYPFITN